jgi:radical SAM protein with 4Fe4S-binding SPASM domain
MKNAAVDLSKHQQVRLFNGIAVEIAAKCNRTCYFCPNAYNVREDVYMSEEAITRLLEELAGLKYSGRIEWYIYNEPTRDRRLRNIIAHAREIVPRACQMINTNGDYFKKPEDIAALFEAGLNQMQINIYSARDASEKEVVFRTGVEAARKREALLQSYVDEISPTMRFDHAASVYLNIGAKKRACKVVAKYGVRPTTKNSEVEGPNYFANRSGLIPDFRPGIAEPLRKMCVRPFRFLNINYNGDALLCCNDYNNEVKIGNVSDHTLMELWNSEILNKYRIKLLHKDRNDLLCAPCEYDGGFYQFEVSQVTTGSAKKDEEIARKPLYPAGYNIPELVQIAPVRKTLV